MKSLFNLYGGQKFQNNLQWVKSIGECLWPGGF